MLPGRGPNMATKKKSTRRRPKRNARRTARYFAPPQKHDEDLRWYFGLGAAPSMKWTTPEHRKRYRRVHRCLDGRGLHLRQYYTGEETDVLRVRTDYRRYVENLRKPYGPAHWEPFLVTTRACLVALLNARKPQSEIVRLRSLRQGREYLATVPVNDQTLAGDDDIKAWLSDGLLELSTWGDIRVSPKAARVFLELASGVTLEAARRIPDNRALEQLKQLCARHLPPPPDVEEVTSPNAKNRAIARLGETSQGDAQLSALAAGESQWDHTKVESNVGDETTTVSELAKKYKLDTKWVRAKLVSLACPGAAKDGAKIPVRWLRSDFGRDFGTAASREQTARDMQKAALKSSRFASRSRKP